jgi:hypothetical protein
MVKRRGKSRSRKVIVTGGVVGAIILFFFNGNFSADFFGDGTKLDLSPAQVEESQDEGEITKKEDIIIEITDNLILLNDLEVSLDTLIDSLGNQHQIVLRAGNAKQVTYDEVKKLLQSYDIVIIEE